MAWKHLHGRISMSMKATGMMPLAGTESATRIAELSARQRSAHESARCNETQRENEIQRNITRYSSTTRQRDTARPDTTRYKGKRCVMAWKHLHGRTMELHSAQSLRSEPVVVTRAALCHASSRARPVRVVSPLCDYAVRGSHYSFWIEESHTSNIPNP